MEDSPANRALLAQFIAQEILIDGRIPQASHSGIDAITKEARRRASTIDGKTGALTLRLRELGGLIRSAGDLAVIAGDEFIEEKHIKDAVKRSRTAEEQIKDRYGSYQKGLSTDITHSQKEKSPYYFWNEHRNDQMFH